MNRDHPDLPELNDFETRLRSLAPRPPLAAAALVEVPDELKQVADRPRWWSVDAPAAYAFYRTVGLSASFGALLGAACTLLILNWSKVPTPHPTPPIVIVLDEASHSNASSNDISKNGVSPSKAAAAAEHNRDSVGVSDGRSNSAHDEMQPQVTSVRRNMNAESSRDLLDELRRLQPGTLGVGTRLMGQQSARLRSAKPESTFELEELSADQSPESLVEDPNGSLRIDFDSSPLPQRAWMRQMLTSPDEFY